MEQDRCASSAANPNTDPRRLPALDLPAVVSRPGQRQSRDGRNSPRRMTAPQILMLPLLMPWRRITVSVMSNAVSRSRRKSGSPGKPGLLCGWGELAVGCQFDDRVSLDDQGADLQEVLLLQRARPEVRKPCIRGRSRSFLESQSRGLFASARSERSRHVLGLLPARAAPVRGRERPSTSAHSKLADHVASCAHTTITIGIK